MFGIDDALLIGGGMSLLGGVIGAKGAKSAAQTQADAATQATALQKQMFDTTQSNLQPYMQAGQIRLNQLEAQLPQLTKPFTMQDFQASPAYQFNLEQGQKAIDKAAAARGAFYQPGTLQDVARFSQGLASNEFQNAFSNYNMNLGNIWNRLYSLTGTGQNAAANLGSFSGQAAGQIGSNITSGGAATAAGTVGQANALTGALGGVGNAYLMSQILGRQQQPVLSQGGGYDPNLMAG